MAIPAQFTTKARGVSFHAAYPKNLLALADSWAGVQGEASLIREPDNPHDANAVAVLVGGEIVGHVPAGLAARLAPEIDAGSRFMCAAEVLIDPDHGDRPGLLLTIQRRKDTTE